ncbi:MAG: pyruvate dehydrogenase kinase [Planctomycetes bacterium]|nr:pyruvate dehydrogenase kinase [Planctomycetota bacterium]
METLPNRRSAEMLAQETVRDKVRFLAHFRKRPVSLGQLFEFGSRPTAENLLKGAQFLHQELPVRLAHRIVELESLPSGLSEVPSVRVVRDMYLESLRELVELPRPASTDGEVGFMRFLGRIKTRHNNVVSLMARGILELKRAEGPDAVSPKIHEFLDRFFMSRIGIRMLIGQHIAIHYPAGSEIVGLIHERCSPAAVVRKAAEDARNLCRLRYGAAPEVTVHGKVDRCFTYVPSHLHHMIFELLKNSMRATVELHGADCDPLPEIRAVVAEGNEDVTIKISDEGGGIARSGISRIWTYLYTTAPPPPPEAFFAHHDDFDAPFAGFGFGLPVSRLYSRYFGGDLQVLSMEGYGTDAYLHLKRIGNTGEALQ